MGKVDLLNLNNEILINKIYLYNFVIEWKNTSILKELKIEVNAYFTNDKILAFIEIVDIKNPQIDLCATSSWFTNKNNIFNLREELLESFNIKQIPRLNKQQKNIYFFNEKQKQILINKLNYYLNSKTTLKSLTGIIKGNNPTGTFSNPFASEMKVKIDNKNIDNFIMFLDIISYDKNDRKYFFNLYKSGLNNFQICKIENLNNFFESDYKKALEFLSLDIKNKNLIDNKEIIKIFKKIEDNKNYFFKFENQLKEIVKKQRSKIKKDIDEKINHFNLPTNYQYERAHIYPVWKIVENIKSKFKNNYLNNEIKTKKINLKNIDFKNWISNQNDIKEIIDTNNLVLLPILIHKAYDNYELFWDYKNGILKLTNKWNVGDDLISFLNNHDLKFNIMKNIKIKNFLEKYYNDIYTKIF